MFTILFNDLRGNYQVTSIANNSVITQKLQKCNNKKKNFFKSFRHFLSYLMSFEATLKQLVSLLTH